MIVAEFLELKDDELASMITLTLAFNPWNVRFFTLLPEALQKCTQLKTLSLTQLYCLKSQYSTKPGAEQRYLERIQKFFTSIPHTCLENLTVENLGILQRCNINCFNEFCTFLIKCTKLQVLVIEDEIGPSADDVSSEYLEALFKSFPHTLQSLGLLGFFHNMQLINLLQEYLPQCLALQKLCILFQARYKKEFSALCNAISGTTLLELTGMCGSNPEQEKILENILYSNMLAHLDRMQEATEERKYRAEALQDLQNRIQALNLSESSANVEQPVPVCVQFSPKATVVPNTSLAAPAKNTSEVSSTAAQTLN